MLDEKQKDALRQKPSLLHRQSQSDWQEALSLLLPFSQSQGSLFDKYYGGLSDSQRPHAAAMIAASEHRHSIRRPDATYLYAWLETAFKDLRNQMQMGNNPQNSLTFGGRSTTVLSAWLRADPILVRSIPFLVSSAFKRSGAYSHGPHEMQVMLDYTVPRHFRVGRFYPEFVSQVPTALIVGALHMDEKACLLNMCAQQCRYAAGLHLKWRSVYPDSTMADDVNQLLSTMQTLDTYVPSLLHSALGLKEGLAFDVTPLPKDLDMA